MPSLAKKKSVPEEIATTLFNYAKAHMQIFIYVNADKVDSNNL